jgi:hypothetical protein
MPQPTETLANIERNRSQTQKQPIFSMVSCVLPLFSLPFLSSMTPYTLYTKSHNKNKAFMPGMNERFSIVTWPKQCTRVSYGPNPPTPPPIAPCATCAPRQGGISGPCECRG